MVFTLFCGAMVFLTAYAPLQSSRISDGISASPFFQAGMPNNAILPEYTAGINQISWIAGMKFLPGEGCFLCFAPSEN
jgi:hypothetical protein